MLQSGARRSIILTLMPIVSFSQQHFLMRYLRYLFLGCLVLLFSACGAGAKQVIPTERPTDTPTFTPTASRTPDFNATPTAAPTSLPGGPTATSIFGPVPTSIAALATSTRVPNPNAARIEFFTSDPGAIAPGDSIKLFWSVRGVRGAVIYRLDAAGVRGDLWNVPPDGNLTVPTRRRDRGEITFLLSAGTGDLLAEQTLTIPLSCPDPWFFQPAPEACPDGPSQPTQLIEESFQRGRMLYIQNDNQVYTLFNDGSSPAWISFENRFDPAIHPELEESFVPPPGFVQPIRILGFVWRGNDTVRNRLGLGLQAEVTYDGFVQSVTGADGKISLYANSADGTVVQLLPGGDVWQIIAPQPAAP